MTAPPSRLLLRLNADIAAEKNPFRADLFRAERASCLVRYGDVDEANKVLADLHHRYDPRPNVEISAWVSLTESLLSFLNDLGSGALDKMRRARALSRAAGLGRLQSLSSAWLAHMEYTTFELDSMAEHVSESLSLAPADFHSARSRASLVVAQALHLAGRMDVAERWYKKVREHAADEGDEATKSALMHNMTWLRMHARRQEVLTGKEYGGAGAHARIGIESTLQYDHLQGISTLEPLKPVLLAQIYALEGRTKEALKLFDDYLTAQPEGVSRLQCSWLAERAWCMADVGRVGEAHAAALEVESTFQHDTQIDDRAATHSRLAQVYLRANDHANANRHSDMATQSWTKFADLQDKIWHLLKDLPLERQP